MNNNILFEVQLYAITLHSRYGEFKFKLGGSHAKGLFGYFQSI
jgi:hypothetical protein